MDQHIMEEKDEGKPILLPGDTSIPQGAAWYNGFNANEELSDSGSIKNGYVATKSSEISEYRLSFSEEIAVEYSFCLLSSLTKFPYTDMSLSYRKKVAENYFEKGKIYERAWDFFYVYPPYDLGQKAILFVPTIQVEQFLQEISHQLQITLHIPSHQPSFRITFPVDGTPRPRFLGHSIEREMAEGIRLAVPSKTWRPDNEPSERLAPSDRSLEAFRKRIETLQETDKRKKAAAKIKKTAERFEKQKSWGRQIKSVQKFLGLREGDKQHHQIVTKSLEKSNLEWLEYDEECKKGLAQLQLEKNFTYHKPAQFIQDRAVVFISVDVESYERDHSKITEIGFATLDTADLTDLSPGENGINWIKCIRAKHYRISENKHLRNKDFVTGCPDQFQFGASEFISLKNAPEAIASCFKPPYSTGNSDEAKRNIILVGHDLGADIEYLKKMGYNVRNLANLCETIDTSLMYRALRREPHPRNLGACLSELNLTGWWLHNAGNDAVYTMQAMVAIALRDLQERGDENRKEKIEETKKQRLQQSIGNAAENCLEQNEGWSSADE